MKPNDKYLDVLRTKKPAPKAQVLGEHAATTRRPPPRQRLYTHQSSEGWCFFGALYLDVPPS